MNTWKGLAPWTPPRIRAMSGWKKVLFLLAHPDDEAIMAPLVVKLKVEGATLRMAYLTRGENGPGKTGIPKGNRVAAIRKIEMRKACHVMGVEAPLFLGISDGPMSPKALKLADSQWAIHERSRLAQRMVESVVRCSKPDVIVSFGPDGCYGHADHRLISNVTTQVVCESANPARLFYYALPPIPKTCATLVTSRIPEILNFCQTHPRLITHAIDCSRYFYYMAKVLACHKSQFPITVKKIQDWVDAFQVCFEGCIHLRGAFTGTKGGRWEESLFAQTSRKKRTPG